jgi:LytS/YehU family sensor histidine kinase
MNRWIFNTGLKYRTTRHLFLFWVTVFVFTCIVFLQNNNAGFLEAFSITFLNSFFFLGYAYIVLFLLIPEFLLKRKTGLFILLFFITGVALSAIKLTVSDEIFYASVAPENLEPGRLKGLHFILVNTKDMTFIVALFCVIKFAKDYVYTQRQIKKLENQNRLAGQRLLQSQLNPHFLFNTINNLYALSLLKPEKTAEMAERMQEVLRYIVEQSRFNFVPLTEEIALVENYIRLEKLRYGLRLRVKILKKGILNHWQVPPMVLFFMAENGIKHGSSSDLGLPWMNISIDARPEHLILSASNSKPAGKNQKIDSQLPGDGLQNLKQRLNILFAEKGYSLHIEEDDRNFKIILELKKVRNGFGTKAYR